MIATTIWPTRPLIDVATLQRGYDLPVGQRVAGIVPVFAANGPVGIHNVAKVAGPGVVTGRSGTIGRVHHVVDDFWPLNTSLYVKDFHGNDPRYVYYLLQSMDLARYHEGSGVPTLNRNNVHSIEVPVPPLEEQRRIAAILDHADAIRAMRRQILTHLDTLTQSIFHDMFGDPAVNPCRYELVTIRSLSEKFSDGPFGSNLKSSHYMPEGVPVIRLQNIGVGRYLGTDRACVSESHYASLSKHDCKPGDVLIGTLGAPNLRACIQPDSMPIALNKADCIQFRVDRSKANATWACWLLNAPGTLSLASALAHGQTRTRIAMGQLRDLKVPVPPLADQEAFASRVEQVNSERAAVQRALAADDELFASLQSRAFSGSL